MSGELRMLTRVARMYHEEGLPQREIAARLSLSERTVAHHVSAVLRKLQLSSRHELTRWAVERRLVDLEESDER